MFDEARRRRHEDEISCGPRRRVDCHRPGRPAFSATERAFGDFKIKRTSLKVDEEGEEREVKGESENGELAVTVTLRRETARSTRVEVTARRTLVTWDKDFARAVLDKIVEFAN